jgi:hypothetical protein
MEFPISRERLQKIAGELEAAETEKWIQSVIETIKNQILLKAYDESPNRSPSLALRPVDLSSKGQEKGAKGQLLLGLPLSAGPHYKFLYVPTYAEQKTYFPLILERLQGLFPGVGFYPDPLHTYLLVDWT